MSDMSRSMLQGVGMPHVFGESRAIAMAFL